MNSIQFEQLRDFAIEHLPDVQQTREHDKHFGKAFGREYCTSPGGYNRHLMDAVVNISADPTLTAVERSASGLLRELCLFQMAFPEVAGIGIVPQAKHATRMRKIAEATKTLTELTGRNLPFDYVISEHGAVELPGVANPQIEAVLVTDPSDDVKRGKMPKVIIGKLAITAALQIERETGKRATAKLVIEMLQSWVDHKDNPKAVVELTAKIPNGVKWVTVDGKEKSYDIKACEKTLETWNKSRVHNESSHCKTNLTPP